MRPVIFLILAPILCGSRLYGAIFPESGPTIASSRAALWNGIALAPADAPFAVKRAICRQINCVQSRIVLVAGTDHFMIAVTIVRGRFPMPLAVPD